MALQPAFIWGAGGKRMTPEEIQRERQVLEALTGRVDTSPVGHWTQGAARVVDALGGVMRERRADRDESLNNSEEKVRIANLLSGIGGGSSAPMTSQQPSTASLMQPGNAQPGGMTSYRDAIASIESAGSGDYAAVGPTHPRLGRALGRYQVMEANIGPWSEKHLGRRITADEFMADPALQDAIFDGEFGSYVQRYGPEGAAQAWFGGPGGVGKTDRRDSLGTSIGAYGEKFNRALGTQPNADMGLATQAAMASADPMQALNTRNVVENPRAVTMPEIAEGVGQYVPRSGFIGANSDMPGAITYDDQGMRPAGAPAPLADDAFNDRFGGAPKMPAGSPGEVRTGPDGQTYMYAETTGMGGATGPMGWIRYNPEAGASPAQAFDAVMPTDPMQTSAMPASAPPVDPMRAELQQMGTSLGSSQLANADPRQGILQVLMAQGSQGGQGEFPPAPGQSGPMAGGMGGGINPAIIASLSDPNASEQERRIASVMLEQELASQQAAQAQQMQMADPSYQMDLERQRLELEQLRNPRQEPTAEMQNLQWRAEQAGLVPGTQEYTDFIISGGRGPENVFNIGDGAPGIGKLSQDFGYVLDPSTRQPVIDPETGLPRAAPVPGSPAALEAQRAAEAEANRDMKTNRTADVVTQDIDRALSIIDSSSLPTTGAIGDLLSGVGGTNARDLRGLLDTVRANAGFAELQAMRDSSPTGGALGQVTERELAFLQATIGNLEQSQTAGQLRDNLNRVYNTYLDIAHGPGNGPERRRLGFQAPNGEVQRPPDVPQDLWDVMSPEDRALWQ